MNASWHTVVPPQKRGDELENLELLRVGTIEGYEMEDVISDDLAAKTISLWKDTLDGVL